MDLLDDISNSDKDTESKSPWYLQVSFTGAAAPFQVPEKYMSMYEGQEVGKKNRKRKLSKERNEEFKIRRAMITAVDDAVGKIIQKLKETGNFNNTVIIFLSDHGSSFEEANAPFTGSRGTLGEGGVRVPALVASPLLGPGAGGAVLED